jgi:MFS transporter, PAT family, beta-lactamase induction signal transducer AmpG
MKELLLALRDRKMASLLFVGFASGLPILLVFKTLQSWMTNAQVDLTKIGWYVSLIAFPYTFKFLWSPLLDRFIPPFLGRRKGWLLLIQGLLVLTIGTMALQDPRQNLELLAVNALLIAFLGASQDIVADAYRTDLLTPAERPIGMSLFTTGYRIALIVSFAGASKLFENVFGSWQPVYLVMAGVMLVSLILTLLAPAVAEPDPSEIKRIPFIQAFTAPFINFFQRQTLLYGSLVLMFIVLYKFSDAMMNAMSIPFLKAACFSQGQIGDVNGFVGVVAVIVGALLGAVVLKRMSVLKGLLIFGSLQALGIIFYFWLAQMIKPDPQVTNLVAACQNFVLPANGQLLFFLAITVEQFFGGMESSAFGVFLMYLCNRKFSATQLALLTSLMAFSKTLAAPSGDIVKSMGWSNFFLLTMVIILPSFVLLIFIMGSRPGQRIDELHFNGMKEELLNDQVLAWNKQQKAGQVFTDNFLLALDEPPQNLGDRSPSAVLNKQLVSSFWIGGDTWQGLTPKQKSFKDPLMPDVIIKLQSTQDPSLLDETEVGIDWEQRMQEYSQKGMKLGLLIDRQRGQVHFYRPNASSQLLNDFPRQVPCDPELPGLTLNMARIWKK